jgi:hypothetical protein
MVDLAALLALLHLAALAILAERSLALPMALDEGVCVPPMHLPTVLDLATRLQLLSFFIGIACIGCAHKF